MTLKFQLQSGKKVEIDIASIDNCIALYRAIVHQCKNAGLDISTTEEDTVSSLILKNIEACLNVISSEMVLEEIKNCCAKVVYDKQRFSMDIFEKVENRQDFIPLMVLVATENIRPFFANPHIILDAIQSQILM